MTRVSCLVKPKFHYADFPVTSATNRDVPFSPNSITVTSLKVPWEVAVMEFELKCHHRLVVDVTGKSA